MGGGIKSRTKMKSKSKKLTSSERQRIYDQIYDQVISDIQAKQVAEEEKARRLAEEARAREKQARKDKARRDEEIRYRASLNAAADILYHRFTERSCPQEQIITRDFFYQRLVETSKMTVGHKGHMASPIQLLDMQARNGKEEVKYENDTSSPTHSTWIDMKPLDASSSSQPLNEVTKSTQNLSLEEKAAVPEAQLM